MKCIIDAQLPYRLASFFQKHGWDAIHTDDLPDKERTSDEQIRNISISQDRWVISKDADFLHSHMVRNTPPKLMMITTGNIRNANLIRLFESHFETINRLCQSCTLLEMNNDELIEHG